MPAACLGRSSEPPNSSITRDGGFLPSGMCLLTSYGNCRKLGRGSRMYGRIRLESPSPGTQALAATPTRFHVTVIPNGPFLVIPKVSSERRQYVPIGWLRPPTIPSDLVFVMRDATLWHFGVITSRMHMSWLGHIGGRLKSDFRYSVGVVYNTFPWPEANDRQQNRVKELAQAVLDVRAEFRDSSLADLYDTTAMPASLVRAHHALDNYVERLYRTTAFTSDRERVEHLFGLYEKLIMPPLAPVVPEGAGPAPKPRRRAARR